MLKTIFSTIGIIFLVGCISNKAENRTHPLENKLIPNVQIATAPKYYSIAERLEYHNILGLGLGIIEDNKLAFSQGYGFAVKDRIVPDSATIFQTGSISKSILGLITLILEEQEKISLDTLAVSYLKNWRFPKNDFSANERITLRHLLNHTAGLNMFNSKGMSPYEKPISLKDIFNGNELSKGVSIDTIAGTQYTYSNYGYGIVQMILEEHTGKSLKELSKELIFEPLGMKNSSFERIVPSEKLSGYAFAYDAEGAVYEKFWRQPLIAGSGGLRSTVKDLSILLLAVQKALNGDQQGLVSPQMVNQIISKEGYNLGFEIEGEENDLSITHTGRVPGFFAYMRIYPKTGKGIVMLCNSDNGGEIFKDILRGASEIYGWGIAKPRIIRPIKITPKELSRYVGEYELKHGGEVYIAQILENGEHLMFKMKDEKEEYPIRMVDANKFVDLVDGSDLEFLFKDSLPTRLVLDDELTFTKIP